MSQPIAFKAVASERPTHAMPRSLWIAACGIIALVALGAARLPAEAGNWPQWRGPAGDGTSDEKNLPVTWNEQLNLVWKAPLPEWGTSTPAIWGDAIFITSQEGDRLLLLRLDKKTGKQVWVQQVGESPTQREAEKRTVQKFHQLHNNASPSPVTDGELVVAHYGNGDLAAYDFDGRQLWHRNLQKEFGPYSIWWGHANSPVLYGDLVLSVCMQDSLTGVSEQVAPSYLVAHDKRTGRQVWKTMRMTDADAEQCDAYTTPILYPTPSRPELIVMGGNQLDAYDPATGKQLWFLPGLVGGRTITGPSIGPGLVYATQGQKGDLLAVKVGGQGRIDEQRVAWRNDSNTPDTCCPVVSGNLLFTVSDNGIAMCFDARDGTPHWRQRLGGNYKASPVAADGKIYFLNMKAMCTVIAASERFEKLAENQLDAETSASPAISDGRIYLRARQHLYCIEKP
jgi:outer membrane protein assembly factor BamB